MHPLRRVALESLDRAIVRVHARKADLLAEIIAPVAAQEARLAGHAGLDGDAVADREVRHVGAEPDDDARGFVAENVAAVHFQRADAAGFPEVDVPAADAGGFDVDEDFVWEGRLDGCGCDLDCVVG